MEITIAKPNSNMKSGKNATDTIKVRELLRIGQHLYVKSPPPCFSPPLFPPQWGGPRGGGDLGEGV